MRKLIIGAVIVALSATSVLAQTTPPAPPAPSAPQSQDGPPPLSDAGDDEGMAGDRPMGPPPHHADEMHHGPDGREMRRERREGPRHWAERRAERQERRAMRGGPRGGGGDRGTTIRVDVDQDGGAKVVVRCAASEPARACADITMEILDRVYAE
jgi:hypothetical protein